MDRYTENALYRWHMEEIKEDLKNSFGEKYTHEQVIDYYAFRLAQASVRDYQVTDFANRVAENTRRRFNHTADVLNKITKFYDGKIDGLIEFANSLCNVLKGR